MNAAVRDEDFALLPQCGEGVRQGQYDHTIIGRNEIGVQHDFSTYAKRFTDHAAIYAVDPTPPPPPRPRAPICYIGTEEGEVAKLCPPHTARSPTSTKTAIEKDLVLWVLVVL